MRKKQQKTFELVKKQLAEDSTGELWEKMLGRSLTSAVLVRNASQE